jgi:hypothetical protein
MRGTREAIHTTRRLSMPKNSPLKKLVLSKETVRALSEANQGGRNFVTTRGPTQVDTYCDCGPAVTSPEYGC